MQPEVLTFGGQNVPDMVVRINKGLQTGRHGMDIRLTNEDGTTLAVVLFRDEIEQLVSFIERHYHEIEK